MFKHVPWASHEDAKPAEAKHGEEEKSLTTILNIDQRGDLTLLIASIMASMRKTVEMNFIANVDPSLSSISPHVTEYTSGSPFIQSKQQIYSFRRRQDPEQGYQPCHRGRQQAR